MRYGDEKFIHLDESRWPKVNPNTLDSLFKAEEDPVFKAIYNYTVKVVDEQEFIMMKAIQRIGGERYQIITIDKNKVLEALEMYKTMQWVPVKDRLPERSGFYLVSIGGVEWRSIGMCRWSITDKKWHGAQVGSVIEDVYCWMPLPKIPEWESMYE